MKALNADNSRVIDVFHEEGADVIGFDRIAHKDGTTERDYFPVAAWTDAESVYRASLKALRIRH